MHRTQLLLDEWQYDGLKSLAERRSTSISAVVREILSRELDSRDGPRRGLAAIRGIGRDPIARGRDHDRHIYKRRKSAK